MGLLGLATCSFCLFVLVVPKQGRGARQTVLCSTRHTQSHVCSCMGTHACSHTGTCTLLSGDTPYVVMFVLNGHVHTRTRGHVQCYTGTCEAALGSRPPDHEARFTLTRGDVHAGHQDLRSVTLGHKAVHGAALGCAHRDTGTRGRARCNTGTRLPACTREHAPPGRCGSGRSPCPGATARGGARRPAGVSHWLSGLPAGRSDRGGPGLPRRVPAGRGR